MNWHATHRDRVAQQGFTQVENVILFNDELSCGARMLYAALKHFAWRSDGEIPPQIEVAKAIGVSERALKTYASELRKAGLLTTQRRMGKPSLYVIEPPQIDDSRSGNICPNDRADSAPTIGQDLPEKKEQEKNLKKENLRFSLVVDHWLALAPPLIAHKRETLVMDATLRAAVTKAVKAHGEAGVVTAISNYAQVIASPAHLFDYRWSMILFFKRANALPMFLPEADPITNFRNRKSSAAVKRGLSFDEILHGGGDEPVIESRPALPARL